jgi:diacylglycerol kinase (ATP)
MLGSVTLILNPTAGRGVGARLAPHIVECLRGHGLDFQLVTTKGPGHAIRLARDATAKGEGIVVAVGGDGTVNEVLNGLMLVQGGPDGTALGVLPIGTGNDFAYGAGVPLDLAKACRAIARGQTKMIDIGLFHPDNEDPRYFGNGIGMGFDAVANIESRKVKRLRGTLLYLVAVLRTLAFYYQAPQTTMGGGFYMTPTSQIDDGLLDLCVAARVSRSKMVRFVPRFMRGTHITDRDITMGQGRSVTVVSDSPWAAQIDGEIYGVGARRFEVELFPKRLCLAC